MQYFLQQLTQQQPLIMNTETTLLNKIGFENAEIYFSGFCSQGDGASFTADINNHALLTFRDTYSYEMLSNFLFDEICNLVIYDIHTINTHYEHENTKRVSYESCNTDDTEVQLKAVEIHKEFEQLRLELCKQIYAALEKEHDYQQSDTCIKESLQANEIKFKESGEVY